MIRIVEIIDVVYRQNNQTYRLNTARIYEKSDDGKTVRNIPIDWGRGDIAER